MAPPTPISQDTFFYSPPWTRMSESILIAQILNFIEYGLWVPGPLNENQHLMRLIHNAVNLASTFDTNLTTDHVHFKVCELEKRYRNYRDLKDHHLVHYSERLNRVFATSSSWEKLAQERPFWCAYMETGEKRWKDLEKIFKKRDPHLDDVDISVSRSAVNSVVNDVWGPNGSDGSNDDNEDDDDSSSVGN